MRIRFGHSLLICALTLTAGTTACSFDIADEPRGTNAQPMNGEARGGGTFNWWQEQRVARQESFDAYLAANADDYKSFKNAPLGSTGIPMVMLRLFPEIFPEFWGAPGDWFARVGFARDDLEPGRVLPLGLGFTGSSPAVPPPAGNVNVNVVNLTCAAYHTGRVEGVDGSSRSILGAPSTTFRNFRSMVFATVTSPKYTADTFLAALAAKPSGSSMETRRLGVRKRSSGRSSWLRGAQRRSSQSSERVRSRAHSGSLERSAQTPTRCRTHRARTQALPGTSTPSA